MEKQNYIAPRLDFKGSAEQVTQGASCPDTYLDASFPSGTPRGSYTCTEDSSSFS
ncbi:hypothetical protein TRIHO_15500 [Tritonibacter horizontis]|uniref:Uncharacterized protein n=1 Tax=Tritonibacter horizontis TaxID=1768241 RepID=A0A132C0A1_9RHOB|nr:hypothetical protein TRIHO_15500 [Tritonibacter horizontis]